MTDWLTLAAELETKTLWNPTILGVLVFLSALGLFCGSVYLLLSTNLGARLGFLIAAACLTGFMVLLSTLWITTQTPLNSPKGTPPKWVGKEVITSLSESKIAAVRDAADRGTRVETADELGALRPGAESALVVPADTGGGETPEPSEFAEFQRSTAFLTDFEGFETYVTGGKTKNLFWHTPKYAIMQFCPALEVEVTPGETPPTPTCDPLAEKRFIVMEYDYGSLRQPPWVYFGVSLVLFLLSLAGLHWHEQDARAQRAGALQPVPTPSA